MNKKYSALFSIALATALLLVATPTGVNASAEPGATVRNEFGPPAGRKPNQCRGACGGGCPKSCDKTVTYECSDGAQFRRVLTYDCGTHQGCRVHDDCLDACPKTGDEAKSCATQCDAEIMDRFGFANAGSWLLGDGPYDGRIQFEYTRDEPRALEPAYSCPDGASRQCSGNVGCMAGGSWVEPVFDSYPGANGMRVADFRAGPACGDGVCEQSADIRITGGDSCPGGSCTRFGMEFDYTNADPSASLDCTTSTSGGGDDFVGDLLKQGADAQQSRGTTPDPNSDDGMEALMGIFSQVMASADSPEDVNISMAPLDEDGNPIESQRVGSTPRDGPPPIPNTVDLPAASGHLFVPMYQLETGMEQGQIKERRVRCTHKGAPVLDTTFRLRAS